MADLKMASMLIIEHGVPDSHITIILYFNFQRIHYILAMPKYIDFNRTLNLLFLARFCRTLFLSNQLEILTQHSQSSQEGCYDVFFRIIPGFSRSLYY